MLRPSRPGAAWTGVEHAYKVLREKLTREGAIVPGPDGRTMRFARDQVSATGKPMASIKLPETTRYEHAR